MVETKSGNSGKISSLRMYRGEKKSILWKSYLLCVQKCSAAERRHIRSDCNASLSTTRSRGDERSEQSAAEETKWNASKQNAANFLICSTGFGEAIKGGHLLIKQKCPHCCLCQCKWSQGWMEWWVTNHERLNVFESVLISWPGTEDIPRASKYPALIFFFS